MAEIKLAPMTKADEWLVEYLAAHGPASAPEVKRAGAEAGYSPRTLQRAMTSIRGRTIGKGPATRWALGVTSVRPRTASEPRQDLATPSATRADDEAQSWRTCESCGYGPTYARTGPPPHRWCSFCGHWNPAEEAL